MKSDDYTSRFIKNTKICLGSKLFRLLYYKFGVFILVISFLSCDFIEYSPFQVDDSVAGKNRNGKAINKIISKSSDTFKPFKIAIIADSHTYYDDLCDQVNTINKLKDIDFVIHMGDFTDNGIYKEFVWFTEIIDELKLPILVTIGNHEYLGNGEVMYEKVFGDRNFTVIYNDCRFVFWDDVVWERNGKDPDFEWLQENIEEGEDYSYQFVFAHIQPWDRQFSAGNAFFYDYLLKTNGVDLSVHGHAHVFLYEEYYEGIPYLIIDSSPAREITVLEINQDSFEVENIAL